MEISQVQRYMIVNQLKILEKLYPEEKEYYQVDRKAFEEGYQLHYKEILNQTVSEDELTPGQCREVIDILNMYRSITFSYMKLDEGGRKEVDKHGSIKFKGFDGNDEYEVKCLLYTRYFIVDLDRFQELIEDKKYPDFNSHWPMIKRYREMLNIYKGYDTTSLTKEMIINLIGRS